MLQRETGWLLTGTPPSLAIGCTLFACTSLYCGVRACLLHVMDERSFRVERREGKCSSSTTTNATGCFVRDRDLIIMKNVLSILFSRSKASRRRPLAHVPALAH